LNTKKNTYNLAGDFKYSYINAIEDKKGLIPNWIFQKPAGNMLWIGADIMTKDFDNNDLGINFETNYYSLYVTES
jgi:hypothetical protein